MTAAILIFRDAATEAAVLKPDSGDPAIIARFMQAALEHGKPRGSVPAHHRGLDFLTVTSMELHRGLMIEGADDLAAKAADALREQFGVAFHRYEYLVALPERPKQQISVTVNERYPGGDRAVLFAGSYAVFRKWAGRPTMRT